MDLAEVTDILGSADECDSALGAKNCIWGDEQKHIKIKFVADKVMSFSSKGILLKVSLGTIFGVWVSLLKAELPSE